MAEIRLGGLDAAVTLHGPAKEEPFTLVVGLGLKDGLGLEQLVRNISKTSVENSEFRKIRFDAEMIGKVKVHRFPLGPLLPDEVGQLFGKDDLLIAFRKDAVFAAFGATAGDQLGEAVTSRPKPVSPVTIHAEGDAKRIAEMIGRLDQQSAAKIGMFGNRLDLLHVTMDGGDKLHLKLAVNLLLAPRGSAERAQLKENKP